MYSKSLALLALSATAAVASPHMAHARFHNRGSGTRSGIAMPTGGPYDRNGTSNHTVSEIAVITRTVSPLPVEETAAATSAPVAFAGNADLSETEVAPVGDSTTSTCLSTRTEYATSMEYVTVTATGSGEVAAAAASSASDVFSLQTTTVPSSLKTASAILSTSSSVNAGQFFDVGGKSRSRGSAASSAVSSAVPTTLATVVNSSKAGSSATNAAPSASASSPSSTSPSVSGGKKGVSYNSASLVSLFSGVSWSYNWASTADGSPGVEFVPMCWGLNSLGSWASDAASAISSGAKAVLSFNEPDLSSQANIDAATAASKHVEAMKNLKGKVAIGSPAITNGAGTSPLMGIDWLNQFFTNCGSDCPVDFVAFHWYADASLIDYFKQHVGDVITAAKANGVEKVWLTEFGAEGSLDAQAAFLAEALPFLDSTPEVERYAYFMASDGTMLTGGALNAAGKAYVA